MPNNQAWSNSGVRAAPDVVLTATYRAVSGGGGPSGPLAYSIDSGVITFTSPDGSLDFGTKPDATTKQVWGADDGTTPNATMGRDSAFANGTFNGALSTAVLGTGMSAAYRIDHSTSTEIAGRCSFSTGNAVIFRRRYDDFDVLVDYVRRLRYTGLTGSLSIGQTITGSTSGATAVIQSFDGTTIYCAPTGGTINDASPLLFTSGETMTTATASMTNNEGDGILRGFNNKIIRFYYNGPGNHNQYISEGVPGSVTPNPSTAQNLTVTELLDGDTTEYQDDDGTGFFVNQSATSGTWVTERFWLKNASAANVKDGKLSWRRNEMDGLFESATFVHQDNDGSGNTGRTGALNLVVHCQVSNGAQPNSWRYFDQIIVEDSFYWVELEDEDTGKIQLLPSVTWSPSTVTARDLSAYLPTWTKASLYKPDGAGLPTLIGSVSRA